MRTVEIFEAYPISLAKGYMKANPNRPYDDIFNAFARYRKKSKDRLYFPIDDKGVPSDADYGVMLKVEAAIREFTKRGAKSLSTIGMSARTMCGDTDCRGGPEDKALYIKGLVSLEGRTYRIGKILHNIEEMYRQFVVDVTTGVAAGRSATIWGLTPTVEMAQDCLDEFLEVKKAYESDPLRNLTRGGSYEVVISRHPYDIAGMSTGRGWTSCTSLTDGAEKKYIATYISTKCLIAYLVRSGDDDIKRPVTRMNIVRYENDKGDFVLVPAGEQYGVQDSAFEHFIKRWCRIVNRGKDDGLYCGIKGQQYASVSRAEKKKNKMLSPDTPDYPYY